MEPWLENSGATGLDDLKIADFPVTGRGVKTLRYFKSGDRILTIPASTLWTVDHALTDPLIGPILQKSQPLSVEDTLAIYLLFVRSRKSGYDGMREHIVALPTSYSSSIFFTEEELEVCLGSSLYAVTKQLQQTIEEDYRSLLVRLFLQHPKLFPLNKFTVEDYKWALCTVWSRCMDFNLPDGKSIRLLAPFADMLNHLSEVQQCHAYDPATGNLSVLAGKDYEAGEQVFINYGPVPNNRLLRLYGFIIPGNPHDSYALVLATSPQAPFFELKEKLWELAGLNAICTIPLTLADPLPKSVLQYLRIQRLGQSDLAIMALRQVGKTKEKLSGANEAEILQFLVDSFEGLLDGFGTKMGVLEEQLARGVFSAGGNAWAAAHVSLGEQRVLTQAKEKAEALLAAVSS